VQIFISNEPYQLGGLHKELVQLSRVALVQEGLGRVLMEYGDRIVDLPKHYNYNLV
jgi:hypothetical protein